MKKQTGDDLGDLLPGPPEKSDVWLFAIAIVVLVAFIVWLVAYLY